jgi:hypothetical protein
MGMAAVPAATTAFGAGAATSMATAPALLSAAAVSAPIASVGASAMMNPLIMNPGGAGFFSSLGTAFSRPLFSTNLFGDISLKTLGYGISTGASIYNSIRQGNILKAQYELEAEKSLTDMTIKRANAEVDAVERLRRLNRINMSFATNAYARGVSGLDGSALLNQIISDQEYGRDYKLNIFNVQNLLATGNVNKESYQLAGQQAFQSGLFEAAIKGGEAAYKYDKLYGVS